MEKQYNRFSLCDNLVLIGMGLVVMGVLWVVVSIVGCNSVPPENDPKNIIIGESIWAEIKKDTALQFLPFYTIDTSITKIYTHKSTPNQSIEDGYVNNIFCSLRYNKHMPYGLWFQLDLSYLGETPLVTHRIELKNGNKVYKIIQQKPNSGKKDGLFYENINFLLCCDETKPPTEKTELIAFLDGLAHSKEKCSIKFVGAKNYERDISEQEKAAIGVMIGHYNKFKGINNDILTKKP